MEARSLQQLALWSGGELAGGRGDLPVAGLSTDSRAVQSGELFVAVKGEKFDGHAFLGEVVRRGVAGMVIRRDFAAPGLDAAVGVVRVEDPRVALGCIAARYRAEFDLPVVAVAGSNGKTSTKELLAAVLGRSFPVLASQASFNNDIGVPHTLLRLTREHRAAIVEVGTNHPGELAPLVRMAAPSLGVITAIGREHLEFFKDLDGVLAEEGALAELLPPDGALFLNGDSFGASELTARTRARVITVGAGPENLWRLGNVTATGPGYRFEVTAAPQSGFVGGYELNLLGRAQVRNALLALAVGAHLGLGRDQIAAGLAAARPAKMRLELSELGGVQLLNDAYNANADSTQVALEALAELPVRGRRVMVLADMAELGSYAGSAHAEMGQLAAQLGIDVLFTIGTQAETTVAAARAAGLRDAQVAGSLPELAGLLGNLLQPGDALLLKASRAAGLERLVDLLRPKLGGAG